MGRKKPPNSQGEPAPCRAATPERSPPKLCFLKSIPSWKIQRGAAAAGCRAAPSPRPGRQGARGSPHLPNPACIFGPVQGPPCSPFQQRGRTKRALVLGTSSRRCWIALPNPDQHLLVPARQLSCQHMPGWPRFPAPPPARSFNWTSLVHAENTRSLVSTRRALTPAKGGDPTPSRRSQPWPSRKALTWKAAVTTLIPLNNVHFHIHQKMVKLQDGGLFTI